MLKEENYKKITFLTYTSSIQFTQETGSEEIPEDVCILYAASALSVAYCSSFMP